MNDSRQHIHTTHIQSTRFTFLRYEIKMLNFMRLERKTCLSPHYTSI